MHARQSDSLGTVGPGTMLPLAPSPSDDRRAGSPARSKLVSLGSLRALRAQARARGQRVVQCHGCFDIVHPGHIRHLRQARTHGDILLVSITGDRAWTKRAGAPLIPEELRAESLAELDCVDWVYIEQRATAAELLADIAPDVYVKGKEYEANEDPRFREERRVVEDRGGKVVFSSGDVVFSSSALIAAMERSVDPYHARLTHLLAQPELDPTRLNAMVSAFRGKRVLVVGEVIEDVYFLCDQPEVAAESPVLTLRPIEQRRYDGGAAIIARHLAAMGAQPVLLSAIPDKDKDALRRRLEGEGVELRALPLGQPLAEKHRYLVGTQKVMKVNNLSPIVLDARAQDDLVRHAEHACSVGDGFDGAIVADFGNGLLSPMLIERLGAALRPRVRVLAGDVSGPKAPLTSFRNFDLLCPSEAEARGATRTFDESLPAVAWRVLHHTGAGRLLITLAAEGLIAFEPIEHAAHSPTPSQEHQHGSMPIAQTDAAIDPHRSRVRGEHVPALCGHAIDALGCGDALLASATLALTTGASTLSAAFLGSLGAAVQAQRLGNTPVSASDLRQGLVRLSHASLTYDPQSLGRAPTLAGLRAS